MTSRWSGRVLIVALAAALAAALLLLWPRHDREPVPGAHEAPAPAEDRALPAPAPVLARPVESAALPARADELHAALGEHAQPVDSGVVVEAIELDRISVCPGEPVHLAARVSGEAPGAVHRWVWRTSGGAALHPGPALAWRAPPAPGRYRVHFQVCTDLGGRSVGVLAERAVDIEVRDCGPGQDRGDSLRIAVSQRGHGGFSFEAVLTDQEAPRIAAYAWDFGDGTTRTTAGPGAEHTYAVDELGAGDIAHFSVTVEARLADGPPLAATALALVRGRPSRDVSPVALDIARWRYDAAREGWESPLTVQPEPGARVTWEHLERVTRYFDDRVEIATLDWREVIQVDERLDGGGFRGRVLVDAASVPAGVKQIIDTLYGQTGDGQEVTLSWSPFKRVPEPTSDAGPPPVRDPGR